MFKLGTKSLANLRGVHPVLVMVVKRAIEISTQDFTVFEGLRTLERQKKLVASGASKTLNSMHIAGKDRLNPTSAAAYGHAVDLVPWIDGQARWEWGAIYPIAAAMRAAAVEQGVADKLNWGGVWDRWISEIQPSAAGIKLAVKAYTVRHPGPDFLDGPHFQIGRKG